MECAAIQDVPVVGKALDEAESRSRKGELDRMAAMLSRLGGRGYQVVEEPAAYGSTEDAFDPDPDSDFAECRQKSEEIVGKATRLGKVAAVLIVAIWLLAAALVVGLIAGCGL